MDWQSIILSALSIIITALITWASERAISYLNTKISNTKHAKYLEDIVLIITNAVKNTYQTYVEALKNKDMFTEAAQKEALEKAKNMAISRMTEDMIIFIKDNYGEVEGWIQESIESVLYDLKKK